MEASIRESYDPSILERRGMYSFINLASIEDGLEGKDNSIEYFIDGILLVWIFNFLYGARSVRVSFDFTSIAHQVFIDCEASEKRVYLFGAEQNELSAFYQKITKRYPNLKIVGFRNGYTREKDWDNVTSEVLGLDVQVVIVGLGAGKQERFLERLSSDGFVGTAFSCGGFIRQESTKRSDYYPHFINKLNLRFIYRMYKEPHTIKRYLVSYPANIGRLILNRFTKKTKFYFRCSSD